MKRAWTVLDIAGGVLALGVVVGLKVLVADASAADVAVLLLTLSALILVIARAALDRSRR